MGAATGSLAGAVVVARLLHGGDGFGRDLVAGFRDLRHRAGDLGGNAGGVCGRDQSAEQLLLFGTDAAVPDRGARLLDSFAYSRICQIGRGWLTASEAAFAAWSAASEAACSICPQPVATRATSGSISKAEYRRITPQLYYEALAFPHSGMPLARQRDPQAIPGGKTEIMTITGVQHHPQLQASGS